MRKVRTLIAVILVTVLLGTVAQGTLARGVNPLGGPAAPPALDRSKLGPRLTANNLASTTAGQAVCLVDSYGFAYNAVITRDLSGGPGYYTIAGTIDPGSGWNWIVSGWIQKYKTPPNWVQYWRLDNPQASGCTGGWVDYAVINSSGAKFTQAGTFSSYCSGSVAFQDPDWQGVIYLGACPAN